jgi:hypothetical protein
VPESDGISDFYEPRYINHFQKVRVLFLADGMSADSQQNLNLNMRFVIERHSCDCFQDLQNRILVPMMDLLLSCLMISFEQVCLALVHWMG